MEWVGNAVVHMRGLAVIAAAASAWVLVSGLPAGSLRRSLRLPSMRASAAAVGTGCVVAVGAYGITGIVSLSLALAALAAATPLALHAERERKSHGEIRDRWPDVLTAGKQLVIVIGPQQALRMACQNADSGQRNTLLSQRINGTYQCHSTPH